MKRKKTRTREVSDGAEKGRKWIELLTNDDNDDDDDEVTTDRWQ